MSNFADLISRALLSIPTLGCSLRATSPHANSETYIKEYKFINGNSSKGIDFTAEVKYQSEVWTNVDILLLIARFLPYESYYEFKQVNKHIMAALPREIDVEFEEFKHAYEFKYGDRLAYSCNFKDSGPIIHMNPLRHVKSKIEFLIHLFLIEEVNRILERSADQFNQYDRHDLLSYVCHSKGLAAWLWAYGLQGRLCGQEYEKLVFLLLDVSNQVKIIEWKSSCKLQLDSDNRFEEENQDQDDYLIHYNHNHDHFMDDVPNADDDNVVDHAFDGAFEDDDDDRDRLISYIEWLLPTSFSVNDDVFIFGLRYGHIELTKYFLNKPQFRPPQNTIQIFCHMQSDEETKLELIELVFSHERFVPTSSDAIIAIAHVELELFLKLCNHSRIDITDLNWEFALWAASSHGSCDNRHTKTVVDFILRHYKPTHDLVYRAVNRYHSNLLQIIDSDGRLDMSKIDWITLLVSIKPRSGSNERTALIEVINSIRVKIENRQIVTRKRAREAWITSTCNNNE